MKKSGEKIKRNYLLLAFALITVIQLGILIYGFANYKESYHSDEMWSYGYANSYYQKDVYQNEKGELINSNHWVDSQVLKDYLVVNKGEQFKYDSILNNQKYDLSPPLHSMILHTICSFFPDVFSRWFAFSINIAAFLICIVYLFKLCCVLKDEWFGICACALYGFSWACRDTYVYLRMYALCAAFAVVYLYNLVLYLKQYKKDKKLVTKNLVGAVVMAYAGFLTHYYMIALIGLMTFFVCVVLLFQKRIKQMFVYGFSMLGVFLLSIACYPTLLSVSKGQGSQMAELNNNLMNYTFSIRTRILINFITQKLYDIHIEIYDRGILKIVVVCLLVVAFWMLPLVYLFRDKPGVKKQLRKIKFIMCHKWKFIKYLWRRINWLYPILLVVMFAQIVVVGETSNVYGMSYHEDRYMTYLYPFAVVFGMGLLYQIGIILFKKKKVCRRIMVVVTIALVVLNCYNRVVHRNYYFEENVEGEPLMECLKGTSVIFVTQDAWYLNAAAPYLMNSDEFFMVRYEDFTQYTEEFQKKIKEGRPVVAIFDMSVNEMGEKDLEDLGISINYRGENGEKSELELQLERQYQYLLSYFDSLESDTSMQLISKQIIFARNMETYRINP